VSAVPWDFNAIADDFMESVENKTPRILTEIEQRRAAFEEKGEDMSLEEEIDYYNDLY
jgi:hypothetical protein